MDVKSYLGDIRGKYFERFEILKNYLIQSNNKFNLTAICDENGIYIKHFLDSVVGESYFKQNANVVEIGSGGGFPSLPLKIYRDDLTFTLIESTGKKCNYLNGAVDKLGLHGVQVINGRAEEVVKSDLHREKYDVAVARAVARLNVLCEYCLPYVKVGGAFIAYKGDCDDELKEARKAIDVLGGSLEKIESYTLTGDEKRTLIIIKKIRNTPLKYPRGQGKERKCPIV